MLTLEAVRDFLRAKWKAVAGEPYLACPKCGSTMLSEVFGMASFSRTFQCANGHTFHVDQGGF